MRAPQPEYYRVREPFSRRLWLAERSLVEPPRRRPTEARYAVGKSGVGAGIGRILFDGLIEVLDRFAQIGGRPFVPKKATFSMKLISSRILPSAFLPSEPSSGPVQLGLQGPRRSSWQSHSPRRKRSGCRFKSTVQSPEISVRSSHSTELCIFRASDRSLSAHCLRRYTPPRAADDHGRELCGELLEC